MEETFRLIKDDGFGYPLVTIIITEENPEGSTPLQEQDRYKEFVTNWKNLICNYYKVTPSQVFTEVEYQAKVDLENEYMEMQAEQEYDLYEDSHEETQKDS